MIMNMMVMGNFKIHMDLFTKENGSNHCFMEKVMKSMSNSNTKDLINKDIELDMVKLYMLMEINIWENFRKIDLKVLVFLYLQMEEK